MNRRLNLIGAIAASTLCLCPLPASGQCVTQETLAFVNAESGRWAALSGGRIAAIYGLTVDSEFSTSQTDDFVADFLADNDDAFGVELLIYGNQPLTQLAGRGAVALIRR